MAHVSGHFDQVAEIDPGESGCRTVELGLVQQQLDVTRPVPQLSEQDAAVVPGPQDSAGDRQRRGVIGGQRLGHRVTGWPTHGVGVDPVLLQRFQLGQPDPHLVWQP